MKCFNKQFLRITLLTVAIVLMNSFTAWADTIDNIRKEYVNVKFTIPSFGSLITINTLGINGFFITIPTDGQTETGWIELTNDKSGILSISPFGYHFNNFKGCNKNIYTFGGGISFGDPPVPNPADPLVDYYWTIEFYVSYTFASTAYQRYNMENYVTLEKRVVR